MTKRFLIASISGIFMIGAIYSFSASPISFASRGPSPVPTATPPIDDDDEIIKIDTEVVNILFTAQDRNRRLLTNLKEQDIRVLENGKEQELVAFARQIDLPLSLAILIDVSGSQERTLPEEKAAAISFLETVMRPSKDEVAIISFTGDATLEQGMTNNLARLRRAIERIRFVPPSGYIGGGVIAGTPPISGRNQQAQAATAIWDAITVTGDEVLGPSPEKTRRAIILLSDGVNTYGKNKLDDAVSAALRSEAIIYSIGIGDNYFNGVDKGSLNRISERTGGRAYFPRDERELRDAFRQIQEEMRSQYLVAYEPSDQRKDGSYRTVEVQLVNQQLKDDKIKLTHRQGYFAKGK